MNAKLKIVMGGILALSVTALGTSDDTCSKGSAPLAPSLFGNISSNIDGTLGLIMNQNERYMLLHVLFYVACFLVLVELLFLFTVYYHLLPSLQRLTKPQVFPSNTVAYMKRVLDLVKEIKCYSVEDYFTGFFRGATFDDLKQGNMVSFLGWAMFGKEVKDLNESQMEQIGEVSGYAAQTHPVLNKVPAGFNPNIKHCCMTYEPIPIIHRPLMTYVIVALAEALANLIFLRMRGFQSLEVDGMTYWYRKQSGSSGAEGPSAQDNQSSTGDEPVVFLHGIATGWGLYLQLARALSKSRTLILIDLDAVKIKSMTFTMPTPQQFVERFRKVLDRHHIPKVSVVGHSFGSITAGWLASRCPERVSHLTLLDPVSMLLCFPEVSYSFLYRAPVKVTEWVIYLMASRELTISHMLHRHFWWYNNALWLEDIPPQIGVVVGLATHDEIINPIAVQEYVLGCAAKRAAAAAGTGPVAGIQCLVWDGYSHGQILIPTDTQAQMVAAVKENEKAGAREMTMAE